MMALLDTSHDLETCEAEIGCPVGQLLTPLSGFRLRDPSRPWAMDNGAYSKFDAKSFVSKLARNEQHRETCLFVCAPDVVGSARRTLEVFDHWKPKLSGWKIALVCQDGQEDLPLPWNEIDAVFIGGSTKWKCSPEAAQIVKAAKAIGKWAHIGRINDSDRWKHFEGLDADSCDGTGIALYSHMRHAIADRHKQESLCLQS